MSSQHKVIFTNMSLLHPSLAEVISPSVGSPTPEKIEQVLQSYNDPKRRLIGAFLGKQLIGVIGFELMKSEAMIQHLSILESFRKKGTGRLLINYVVKNFQLNKILAGTDSESVGFYKNFGFTCEPFKGKYGIRYSCSLSL